MKFPEPANVAKVFLLSADNGIVAFSSKPDAQRAVTDGDDLFDSPDDLQRITADWPSSRLVRLWNRLPDVVPVKKFMDRPTALKRIWAAVQILESVPPKSATTSEGGPGTGRSGTKKAMVLELLNRPEGASVREIMAALGWQSHSVRGFLSALSKKGTAIHSCRRADGDRAYAIKAATAVQAEGVPSWRA
jgi:hypothetical protein